jgi:hypothetical protein
MSMDGHHLFNTFGFKFDKRERPLKKPTNVDEYTNWEYKMDGPDWFTDENKSDIAVFTLLAKPMA